MKSTFLFWGFTLLIFVGACTKNSKEHPVLNQSSSPLSALQEGNQRFLSFKAAHPDQSPQRLHEVAQGQHPFAVIVSCSDSRVSPELVFDQGLGDLFVIRTAGNVLGDFELASIEYAVEHLNAPLVVVMGHEKCGAIQAFVQHPRDSVPGHINQLLNHIRSEKEEQIALTQAGDTLNHAIKANIQHGVNQIRSSEPIIAELVKKGKLQVLGAVYHIENGRVEFFEQ